MALFWEKKYIDWLIDSAHFIEVINYMRSLDSEIELKGYLN